MTNLEFTTPILDAKGNEIDNVDILLTTTDVQDLIYKVVKAVELGEIDDLKEFANLIGLTEPTDTLDYSIDLERDATPKVKE